MAYSNKYKGDCVSCGRFVAAREGFYFNDLTCTEQIYLQVNFQPVTYCLPRYNAEFNTNFETVEQAYEHKTQRQDASLAEAREKVRQGLINGGLEAKAKEANVRSLAQVILKVTGAEIAIADLDWDQATDVGNELQKRIDRKATKAILDEHKATNTCNRCGGAGRADKWIRTGSVCYQCGGTGKYHNL